MFSRAALLLSCCAWLALAGLARADAVPEQELKAAFVFNFTVFTEWPSDALAAGASIGLCANASSPMIGALNNLNDKMVNGHRLAVRPYTTLASLRGCHVLVLDNRDRERWAQLRRELPGTHVLTVADERAGGEGAIIALSVENQRVGFDIDMGAARGAQLNLSSKLLRLARSVQ